MKTILILIAVASIQATAFSQQNMADILNSYLKIKDALFTGDSRQAHTLVIDLLQSLEKTNAFTDKSEILQSLQEISKARDIEKQRKAFAAWSTSMWQSLKKLSHVDRPIYYYHCPMKKAFWLSIEFEIKNPYFGLVMPACGNLADQKIS